MTLPNLSLDIDTSKSACWFDCCNSGDRVVIYRGNTNFSTGRKASGLCACWGRKDADNVNEEKASREAFERIIGEQLGTQARDVAYALAGRRYSCSKTEHKPLTLKECRLIVDLAQEALIHRKAVSRALHETQMFMFYCQQEMAREWVASDVAAGITSYIPEDKEVSDYPIRVVSAMDNCGELYQRRKLAQSLKEADSRMSLEEAQTIADMVAREIIREHRQEISPTELTRKASFHLRARGYEVKKPEYFDAVAHIVEKALHKNVDELDASEYAALLRIAKGLSSTPSSQGSENKWDQSELKTQTTSRCNVLTKLWTRLRPHKNAETSASVPPASS